MSIVIKTQLGNGGKWYTEGTFDTSAVNLLSAVGAAQAAIDENKGVGGYTTIIEIDGEVLSWLDGWPSSLAEAETLIPG